MTAKTMLPRRRFIQGLAAGGLLLGLPTLGSAREKAPASATQAPVLEGTDFHLVIGQQRVNFTGSSRTATTVNGSLPAPTLVWREGQEVTIKVTNQLAVPSSIHWHGMILPFQMDGVPGISFRGIAPGETFTYRFKVRQSGTYWYHSHSGFQEMTGLYGAIVIKPAAGERFKADREHLVLLSDWTDEEPMALFSKLKAQSDYGNYIRPTAGDFIKDVSRYGLGKAMDKRRMWNQMRMNPTDLADLGGDTFTYLLNGNNPAGNWTGLFKPGEKLRLRFINGSSNSFFDVRIPGLKLQVIQADGQDVEPVTVDEFRFGAGETLDVLVTPKNDAYCLFAQSMDRTGYAAGTLAVRPGLKAPVPALEAPQWLTMTDMMGSMDMGHGKMAMDHTMAGMQMGAMDHGRQGMGLAVPSKKVRHASSEYGPSVDMRVDSPRTNLDDPGVGLRNNGRRVLTLADLATIGGPLDQREPGRELELHLTGNMERYSWSFDGLEFGKSTPVHFRHGERLRVILQNDTMMTHPMHLHGMWSELEDDKGNFVARKHTIPVQPAQRISFRVTADALGRWAWHCHLLFHMDAGMFREVVVA
ncbi:copper resistance system multicopper oxidase [Gallaecimonas kandeliae]|uniref:copper resistance system multicopper oxidase n=1 Tax=Gallaecimonas kandeliae TaxID=3029055 RepID=UPI002649BA80|nr:copper resistance system multicopper oxidase [Gallaecimonas kandeliae]WKE65347.1 copper resistance system multicopper oxidase [Gallaecimonas kandeliae]